MARKTKATKEKGAAKGAGEDKAYDLSTPLWSRYYEAVRKRIRFPRYYNKSANW